MQARRSGEEAIRRDSAEQNTGAASRDLRRPSNILITGRPGIGKTTVVMKLAEGLKRRIVAGFYTEEIRRGTHREGFRAVTFSGRTATLAHVDLRSRSRVGRYGVDVATFENLVLPDLTGSADLMLIDEIGKMECFSSQFVAAVRQLLDGATTVVATVAARGKGFIGEVKTRPDVEIVEATYSNREDLPQRLTARLPSEWQR